MATKAEIKISIAKLIELAYSEDSGLTKKIVAKKGGFKISVDEYGNASLSGSAGILTFKGSPALESLGAKIKFVSISFTKGDGYNVGYIASYSFMKIGTLSISGNFNIEEMILACSGLLCNAARAMKSRDEVLEKAMGY